MFHPDTAYTLAKERERELERSALEGSAFVALVARLLRRG